MDAERHGGPPAEAESDGAKSERPNLSQSQVLWAAMLVEKRKELMEAKADKVLTIHSFSAMQGSLASLEKKARSGTASKLLLRLNPACERLKCFTKAISTFIQADPTYSSLVWGGLIVCLECFTQSNRMFSEVIDLFDSLTGAMPRFEKYMELYPKSEGLGRALCNIYRHYVDACICAIRFFRHKSWYRPATLIFSNVVQAFQDATESIEKSNVEFESEAKLAHDIVAAQHRKNVEAALGSVSIRAKTPSRLFSVPFPRNIQFYGHKDELQYVFWKVQDASRSQKSCVIRGIGGVGKTQMALEFAYRFQDKFRYIFWLHAEDEANLFSSYGGISTRLGLSAPGQAQTHLTVEVMRQWLCDNHGWLLIFDNVDGSPAVLNQFWPPCQHGSIILTSQRTDLDHRARWSLALRPLDSEDGPALLLKHLPNDIKKPELALLKDLSKEVDGLPLLLVGLGGFVSQSYTSLEDILHELRESRHSAGEIFSDDSTASAAFQYERPIQLVFRLSLDRLPRAAREVINVMAMLSAEEIPESLFLARGAGQPGQNPAASHKISFAREVRQSLTARHLTEIRRRGTEMLYSMHRSVQRSILIFLDEDLDERQRAFNEAVTVIYGQLPRPSPIMVPLLEGFELFAAYIPHVISIRKTYAGSQPPIKPVIQFAEMLCSAAAYLYESGLTTLCLEMVSTGEQVCKQLSGMALAVGTSPSSRETSSTPAISASSDGLPPLVLTTLEANIMAYGAGVLWTTGGISDRQQAHEMTWRVLELREQYIKDTPEEQLGVNDHVLLANAYNDWALQLINEWRYAEAKSYSQKSLAMKERLLDTEKHQFEFFISKILLACAHLAEGHRDEAVRMAREAINHIVREKGEDNPYTLHYKFHVANVLVNTGQYSEAADMYSACLAARVSLFGENNPDTLNSNFAAALCLYRMEDYVGANRHLEKCLEQPDAPQWSVEHVIRARYLQSLVKQRLGDPEPGRWRSQELEARKQRDSLLLKHAEGGWTVPLPCRDELVYFDYLVNAHAGRTTIGLVDQSPD